MIMIRANETQIQKQKMLSSEKVIGKAIFSAWSKIYVKKIHSRNGQLFN